MSLLLETALWLTLLIVLLGLVYWALRTAPDPDTAAVLTLPPALRRWMLDAADHRDLRCVCAAASAEERLAMLRAYGYPFTPCHPPERVRAAFDHLCAMLMAYDAHTHPYQVVMRDLLVHHDAILALLESHPAC